MQDVRDLKEDAQRIKNEIEHTRRNRENLDRQKTLLRRNINDAQKILDQTLQVARRAQDEVTKSQKHVDEETERLRRIDDAVGKLAESELTLAAQLRDLTGRLNDVLAKEKEDNDSHKKSDTDSAKSFKTYR